MLYKNGFFRQKDNALIMIECADRNAYMSLKRLEEDFRNDFKAAVYNNHKSLTKENSK